SHIRLRRLHIHRQRILQGRKQRARLRRRLVEKAHFVWHADAYQRTARALGAVFERWGDVGALRQTAQSLDREGGHVEQLLVEDHPHALLGGDEVNDAFIALVAVLAQNQALSAKLHTLGIVGTARNVGALAALVVDRHYTRTLTFH